VVKLDFSEILPPGMLDFLSDALVERILDDLGAAARAKWIRLAQTELSSSKRDYVQGIQEIEAEEGLRTIRLVGWLPNAVAHGLDAWDLRTTLLNERAKRTQDGNLYRPIPFRHGTPGTEESVGTPMGVRYGPQGAHSLAFAAAGIMDKGAAAELGKAVYAQAKRLRGRQSLGARTMVPKGKSMVQVPKLAPWHSTDIFAGMQRVQKKYRTATQAHYVTFRTISSRNTTGWIHPGIEARNFAEQVEDHVNQILGDAVHAAVSAAMGASR
jgi:hypothetical protein